MEAVLSASAREDAGGLSLPVMTIIAMLLLMLPYLIRRYSGRSVTELLRPSALLNGIDNLAARLRGRLFGRGKAQRGGAELSRPREAENERSRARRRAENARNDYLKALSELLAFTRKNHLFAVVPGNLAYQGKTAELDALIVTRAKIVGILAYSFGGTIECRSDGEDWQVTDEEGARALGSPVREADAQDELVRGALLAGHLGDVPYQTVMLFTGSDAVLTGERPQGSCTREELFRMLEGGGSLDPREIGKRLAALRAGKTK